MIKWFIFAKEVLIFPNMCGKVYWKVSTFLSSLLLQAIMGSLITLWFSTERSWLDHLLIKTPVKVKSVEEKFTGASTLNDITWFQTIFVMKILNRIFFKKEHFNCEHIFTKLMQQHIYFLVSKHRGGGGCLKILAYKGFRLHPKEVPFSGLRHMNW